MDAKNEYPRGDDHQASSLYLQYEGIGITVARQTPCFTTPCPSVGLTSAIWQDD